jgi:hypothetical protein
MIIEIDKKNPVSMAYNSIIISFVIFVGLFYLFTPSWVQVVNQITGKLSLSWPLILCYSITFSFVFGIFVFMIILNQKEVKENIGYEMNLDPNVFIEN